MNLYNWKYAGKQAKLQRKEGQVSALFHLSG